MCLNTGMGEAWYIGDLSLICKSDKAEVFCWERNVVSGIGASKTA
jgi:hypothetical protein